MLISGPTMEMVTKSDKASKLYTSALAVLIKAETVVMYRSTPAQKAQVVRLIKSNAKGKTTLAIGDGANDVNMI